MFESTGNANVVYEEFRKFDQLLPKLATGSLKKGKVLSSPHSVFVSIPILAN